MKKILLIGLDLSFNSTGICITYMEDEIAKVMKFYRIIFDNSDNKTGKVYKPHDIPNINQIIYRMPTNISIKDLTSEYNDNNSTQQIHSTLQAMICSRNINKILMNSINLYSPDKVIITIENYIMPSFGGPAKLKDVSGLILLQGFVREFIIRLKLMNSLTTINLNTPTPSNNKKSFCGIGNADKQTMLEYFLTFYNGNKLLPDISHGKIDDIVDAFSLMIYGYKNLLGIQTIKENKSQKLKTKTTKHKQELIIL